jgi:hypothetical protein
MWGEVSRTPCVVDARLALSRHGQLLVARLARNFAVWLPQELQRVLRNTRGYLDDARRLTPSPYCAAMRKLDMDSEADIIGEELAQWDRLPYDDDLAALPLYYVGERADECFTPPDVDRKLRDRYEQLQRGVHHAMTESEYDLPRGQTVAACIGDAVALCAALEPYGAFILTRLEADAKRRPALCDYLDAWGVTTTEVAHADAPSIRWLRVALARTGLAPIGWAGIVLVAVHVIIPGFPVFGGADRGLDDDGVARLWGRASVFWHRV